MDTIIDRDSSRKKYLIDLKNYKINQKIKSGGFGQVFSIQNLITKEEYAAKIISLSVQTKKMINREIGIMVRLHHPAIIPFQGYSLHDFDDQDNVTIVMKLAKKGSLATILQNVKKGLADEDYDNTARQKILIGIARGMMHLHKNRIIHRDLKPGNILLDDNLNPYITDFGVSKFCDPDFSSEQSQSCGTSIYMAPEVIEGWQYNGKADVYSFGILMFEVVTDSIPYPSYQNGKMNFFQFSNKVIKNEIRPKFTTPIKESLKKLITQCWSNDPKERPTFEEIFNKLAFNLEESIYDVFESDDKYKYYLDDVDVEEVLNYAYDIIEGEENNVKNTDSSKIAKIVNEQEAKIADLTKNFKEISDLVNKLKSENTQLKKNNSEMQHQVDAQKKQIQKITTENDNLKKENEKFLNKVKSLEINNVEINKKVNMLEQQIKATEKANKTPETTTTETRTKTPEKTTTTPEKTTKTPGTRTKTPETTTTTSKHTNSNSMLSFTYDHDKFDGIFKYLLNNKIPINVTASSVCSSFMGKTYLPINLVNSNSPEDYKTPRGSNAWVCFDIFPFEIKISAYTIKSSNLKSGHIRSWTIAISKNGLTWTNIDTHSNCYDLNGPNIVKTFVVNSDSFGRFIRFQHKGYFWGESDNFCLQFNSIEFFGDVICKK